MSESTIRDLSALAQTVVAIAGGIAVGWVAREVWEETRRMHRRARVADAARMGIYAVAEGAARLTDSVTTEDDNG